MATVAVWLASLMSLAISSLLSIIVWVKTKLFASIDFTAWSVTRLTSPAKCLAFSGQGGQQAVRFFVEDARHFADVSRNVGGKFFRPAGDVARNVCANSGERALGFRSAAAD